MTLPFDGPPEVSESWRTRAYRWYLNLFPAFRGSGARATHIASDWSEIRARLPLSWRSRNLVGTIYGGSMYSTVDPFYMIQLMKRLGTGYIVWDKSASIRFLRPGRSTLHARFLMGEEELDTIRVLLETEHSVDRTYTCELMVAEGEVCAVVDKVVYLRKKPPQ